MELDHTLLWSELNQICEDPDWADWCTFGPVGLHRVQAVWEHGNTHFMFNGGMVFETRSKWKIRLMMSL